MNGGALNQLSIPKLIQTMPGVLTTAHHLGMHIVAIGRDDKFN